MRRKEEEDIFKGKKLLLDKEIEETKLRCCRCKLKKQSWCYLNRLTTWIVIFTISFLYSFLLLCTTNPVDKEVVQFSLQFLFIQDPYYTSVLLLCPCILPLSVALVDPKTRNLRVDWTFRGSRMMMETKDAFFNSFHHHILFRSIHFF